MHSRPPESKARAAIEGFLNETVPGFPQYELCEDGHTGWAFWIAPADTTSYLSADLSIEWYGTGWPEFRNIDEVTGDWFEVDSEKVDA